MIDPAYLTAFLLGFSLSASLILMVVVVLSWDGE